MTLLQRVIPLFPLAAFTLISVGANNVSPTEALGKQLFFDPLLSDPPGQSCASCHAPQSGFADPRQTAVSEGVHHGRFTRRNAPSIAYLGLVLPLHYDEKEGTYIGGLFYDGRAKGFVDQIEGPLFSPVEMANASKHRLIERLRKSSYLAEFRKLFGEEALADTDSGFAQLGEVLAAFQRSREVSPFSSKYDLYLAGKVTFTAAEQRGLKLFADEKKGNCAACHPHEPGPDGSPPLFTDFTYDNIGLPKNTKSPYLTQSGEFNPAGKSDIDLGLGATVNDRRQNGKFKVTTLRNISLTAPYMHNGMFATLEEVVDFYNTRDVDPKWSPPEVPENVNKEELGDLKLADNEVQDIVTFLKTLTDGYTLPE